MTIKGASGKLKTVMIGDHLTHLDLSELEQERKDYFAEKAKPEGGVLDADYVPVDFDAYTIPDLERVNESKNGDISKEEKIWKISSLTASIDDETKILILPQPESKRATKIVETTYGLTSYESLKECVSEVEGSLAEEKQVVKRFEDKTREEIEQDQVRKRKQQFGKLVKFRTY